MTSATYEQVARGERVARERNRRLVKARKARADKASRRIWAQVKDAKRFNRCKCELRRGMTVGELAELGAGCTAHLFWICPVLDKYRRLLGH